MKVSVVIPVYNYGRYIEQCLQSVINQSYRNIEIIVVDDGSTDESPAIIDAMSVIDQRIILISQENSGTHIARLTGIKKAKGGAIMHLDADDYLEVNAIALLVERMELTAADLVIGNYNMHRLGKARLIKNFDPSGVSNNEMLRQLLLGNLSVHLWGKLYKRALMTDISLPIARPYTEDVLTNFQILCNHELKAVLVDEAIWNYVIHDNNISYSEDSDAVEGFFNEFDYVEAMLNEKKLSGLLQAEIAVYKCKNWLIYCRKNGLLSRDKNFRRTFKNNYYTLARNYLPIYLKLEFNAYNLNVKLGKIVSALMIWVKRNFMASYSLEQSS